MYQPAFRAASNPSGNLYLPSIAALAFCSEACFSAMIHEI
jgi:hypothetical protein